MNQDALCRCVDTIWYIHHVIQGYREMSRKWHVENQICKEVKEANVKANCVFLIQIKEYSRKRKKMEMEDKENNNRKAGIDRHGNG